MLRSLLRRGGALALVAGLVLVAGCNQAAAPGFAVSASPGGLGLVVGHSASTSVTVTPTSGFSGSVGLSLQGPGGPIPGATLTPSSVTVTPGLATTATVKVAIAANAQPGVYSLDLVGTSGSAVGSVPFALALTYSGAFPASGSATYPVGSDPSGIVMTDVDLDGHPDLVVSNANDNTVSVLVNQGDGTYPTSGAPTYRTGASPLGIAVGDLNGDGYPDIVTANNQSGGVSVLLDQGDGTFPATATDYLTGLNPVGVAVVDVNGDGHPDVVSSCNCNAVVVLLNQGDGTFSSGGGPAYGTQHWPGAPAVGDLDGDGHSDLVVPNNGSASLSVLLNRGDGTFPASGNPTYVVGGSPYATDVGDLNGDGVPDVAVATNQAVVVLLGKGDGTFPMSAMTSYAAGLRPQALAMKDVNGDGYPDLVVGDISQNDVLVLLNRGDGTFPSSGSPSYPVGAYPGALVAGDVNGDGRPDVAVANAGDGTVSVLFGE